MKEYKLIEVNKKTEAEQIMNDMAKQGWEVAYVTVWQNITVSLLITFSREV